MKAMNWKNKTKHGSAALRRLVLVILGLLLGVNVYLANAKTLARNQLPMPFDTGVAVVLSGSMSPTLEVDDLIVVRKAADYALGDIIVYQTPRELIVHRIVAVEADGFVTRGDANNAVDLPIASEAIQGKVVARIPMVGRFVNVLRTPLGILGLLALALGLIELSFRKTKKADSQQIEAIKEEIRRLKAQQEDASEQ